MAVQVRQPGLLGHADFSTRFQAATVLPEVEIGAYAGGVSENRSFLNTPQHQDPSRRALNSATSAKASPSRR